MTCTANRTHAQTHTLSLITKALLSFLVQGNYILPKTADFTSRMARWASLFQTDFQSPRKKMPLSRGNYRPWSAEVGGSTSLHVPFLVTRLGCWPDKPACTVPSHQAGLAALMHLGCSTTPSRSSGTSLKLLCCVPRLFGCRVSKGPLRK